jgi:hypothetical protein
VSNRCKLATSLFLLSNSIYKYFTLFTGIVLFFSRVELRDFEFGLTLSFMFREVLYDLVYATVLLPSYRLSSFGSDSD